MATKHRRLVHKSSRPMVDYLDPTWCSAGDRASRAVPWRLVTCKKCLRKKGWKYPWAKR